MTSLYESKIEALTVVQRKVFGKNAAGLHFKWHADGKEKTATTAADKPEKIRVGIRFYKHRW